MPVAIEEIGSPRYRMNINGMTAERTFHLADETQFGQLLNELFGTFNVANGTTVIGTAGAFPGIPRLLVDDIDVGPFVEDGSGGLDANGLSIPMQGLLIRVKYATRPWDMPPGILEPGNNQAPYADTPGGKNPDIGETVSSNPTEVQKIVATHRVEMTSNDIEIPNSQLRWRKASPDTGDFTVKESVRATRRESLTSHSITWHRVKRPPWKAIRYAQGRVNSARFLGHPAQCVLFLGMAANRQYHVDGDRHWAIEYRFLVRDFYYDFPSSLGLNPQRITWNHYLRPEWTTAWENEASDQLKTPWQKLIVRGSGDPGRLTHQTYDLMELFTQDLTDQYEFTSLDDDA